MYYMDKKFVVYSPKAAALYGTFTYELKDGRTVEGTAVEDQDKDSPYLWDDKVTLGEFKRYVSNRNHSHMREPQFPY